MLNSTFVVVFPGQGSQSVGMLKDLAADFPLVEQTFREASDSLGFDLWNLSQEGPADALNQTHNTQPAMLAAGVAVWRVWKEQGGADPERMAGHSLGEYTALVCSGAIGFADAIKLVATRGRLMQAAVPEGEGAMAAILGLENEPLIELCKQAAESDVVEAVNFNSPGQVVVAGSKAAVARLIDLAKAAGAKRALPLPVSVPSHCALMKPAAEQLAGHLAEIDFSLPSIPVTHNVTVETASAPDELRELLAQQLYNPVRWSETIQSFVNADLMSIVEMGPGKVLTGLNKRINRSIKSQSIFDPTGLKAAVETLNNDG